LLLSPLTPHLPNHDQSGVYAETYCQSDAFVLFQTGIQVFHRSENSQTSPYCSLGVIFMGLRIAEIDEQTIPKELGDMPIVALNNFRTHLLICPYHVTPVFRVELRGQLGGIDQITEHGRELATFSFWCVWFEGWSNLRGLIVLHRTLLLNLERWRS